MKKRKENSTVTSKYCKCRFSMKSWCIQRFTVNTCCCRFSAFLTMLTAPLMQQANIFYARKKHENSAPATCQISRHFYNLFMALYISTAVLPWISGIELGGQYNLWLLRALSKHVASKAEWKFIISRSPSCTSFHLDHMLVTGFPILK